VRLKIDINDSALIILVADNGRGFNSAIEIAGGEGLQGLRLRMKQLKGHCDVRSRPGDGTEVELRLPLGNLEILHHD
jgi:signal transduction histidine kinase